MRTSLRLPLRWTLALLGVPLFACNPDDSTKDSGVPLTVVSVAEDITTATTWTADNLYRVDVSISVLAPLTLEPGTIVKLGEGLTLSVPTGGSILAEDGNADHPCVFTSAADDAWGGDTNEDGSTTTAAPGDWGYIAVSTSGSVFDHCLIQYGGATAPYNGAFVVSDDAAITITNSTFAHNQGGDLEDTRAAALNAAGAGPGTVLTADVFTDNDLPLVVGDAYDVDDTLTFSAEQVGNTYNAIAWGGGYELRGDVTWSNTNVPYVATGNPIGIPEDGSLTIGPGVILKMPPGQRIDATGVLLATDTVFTSLADDTQGGDTNADGVATAPVPGDWAYLALSDDGSVVDGCSFFYAGSTAPYSGTMVVMQEANPQILDSTFAHNAGGTFEDNRAAALDLAGAGSGVVVRGNTFYDNDLPMLINGDISLDDSNHFSDVDSGAHNALDAISMDGSAYGVHGATSWAETEVPVVLVGTTLIIEEGASLTLGDGAVVKLDAGRIDVSGGVTSGTDSWFTSLKDDAHCGDTNADGGASTPQKGDWSGVNLCLGGPCEWATWDNILYAAYP